MSPLLRSFRDGFRRPSPVEWIAATYGVAAFVFVAVVPACLGPMTIGDSLEVGFLVGLESVLVGGVTWWYAWNRAWRSHRLAPLIAAAIGASVSLVAMLACLILAAPWVFITIAHFEWPRSAREVLIPTLHGGAAVSVGAAIGLVAFFVGRAPSSVRPSKGTALEAERRPSGKS